MDEIGKIRSKILVVDDISKNLQLVGNILREENYQIIFALNGETAIKAARKNHPDLILLDISMPEIDGFEVAGILKSDIETAQIPIIFLTARTQTEEVIKGFEMGAVDYITKPFNPSELKRRVKTHIELKQSIDLIKKQNEELRKLNETKDRIFSIISHDLRGPVGSFYSVLDYLKASPETNASVREQMMGLLHQSAANTFNLLENLLSWSKSQLQSLKARPELIDVHNIILECINLMATAALHKNITIQYTNNKSCIAFADGNMISTVIRNLLTNAVKFTPTKGLIIIKLKTYPNFVEIEVVDNGVGIPPENLNKLFKTIEHFTTHGTNSEKGSGLGLLLCKEFVEQNGGTIQVSSELGKGTTFSFKLPLNQTLISTMVN
jgi:signal transduction histidine kinase